MLLWWIFNMFLWDTLRLSEREAIAGSPCPLWHCKGLKWRKQINRGMGFFVLRGFTRWLKTHISIRKTLVEWLLQCETFNLLGLKRLYSFARTGHIHTKGITIILQITVFEIGSPWVQASYWMTHCLPSTCPLTPPHTHPHTPPIRSFTRHISFLLILNMAVLRLKGVNFAWRLLPWEQACYSYDSPFMFD